MIAGLVLSFVLAYQNDVFAYILPHLYPYNNADLNDLETYLEYSYFYTYTRMACYYLGALFGCYYFTYKKELADGQDGSTLHQIKDKLTNPWIRLVIYLLSLVIMAIMFIFLHNEA